MNQMGSELSIAAIGLWVSGPPGNFAYETSSAPARDTSYDLRSERGVVRGR